ncbi:MAG: 4Fe-4S dicluster domain-containing protein [Nitrospirota bacterium]
MLGKRLMIDTSKCIACRACQVACKQWHSLPSEDTTFTGSYQNPPDMSGANLTVAKFTEAEIAGKLRFLFFKDMCRHCENPTCKVACPLVPKAIKRKAISGIVFIRADLCHPNACSTEVIKPCQQACPFKTDPVGRIGVPKYNYEKDGPVTTVMRKCDFCYNRMNASPEATKLKALPFISADGKTKSALPACQVTCPPGAIMSGAADPMKRKAKRRVTYLIANGYPNANVYPAGLQTHVIWVLTELPAAYGIVPA